MWGFIKLVNTVLNDSLTLINGNFKSNKFFFSFLFCLSFSKLSFLHYKTGLARSRLSFRCWLCEIPCALFLFPVFIWHLKHLCFVDRYWTPVIVLPELIRQLEHVYHAYQFSVQLNSSKPVHEEDPCEMLA